MEKDPLFTYHSKQLESLGFMEFFKRGDTIHWYKKNPDSEEAQSFKGFLHSYDIFYNEIRFTYKTTDDKAHHRLFFFEEEEYNASTCRLILIEKQEFITKPYLGI